MFTKMFYFLKAESFYKSNLAVIVQQPNKMTNCRTEFVETLRFTAGMLQSLKICGGQVVMRRAAAARRCLLFRQNLGGQLPPPCPPA